MDWKTAPVCGSSNMDCATGRGASGGVWPGVIRPAVFWNMCTLAVSAHRIFRLLSEYCVECHRCKDQQWRRDHSQEDLILRNPATRAEHASWTSTVITSSEAGACLRVLACSVEADALQRCSGNRPAPAGFGSALLAISGTPGQKLSCQRAIAAQQRLLYWAWSAAAVTLWSCQVNVS